MLVMCLALYFFLGRTLGLGGVSSTPDASGVIFATTPTIQRSVTSASVPAITQTRPVPVASTLTPVPAAPTPIPSPTRIRHRVQPGDTLSTIAEKYDVSVQSIMRANNLRNDVIRIGDELIIPYPTPTPAH
jgi:LysM repeat protein